jgi:FKBP-type peptidyl-prolyl cis-trans isomerase 2
MKVISFFLKNACVLASLSVVAATCFAEGVRYVEPGDTVAIRFTLKDADTGQVVTQTPNDAPFSFIIGQKKVVPGLEEFLVGKVEGFSGDVVVAPEKAYGTRNEKKVISVERKLLPPQALSPGVFIDTKSPKTGELRRAQVVKLDDNGSVTLDFNHPMAGKALSYSVVVVGVQKGVGNGADGVDSDQVNSRNNLT